MSFRDLGEVLLFTTTATIVKSWSSKVNVRPNEKKAEKDARRDSFPSEVVGKGTIDLFQIRFM